MKKIIAAVFSLLMLCGNADAAITQIKICDAKALGGSTTTDCTYVDLSSWRYFSFQASCADAGDSSMSVDFDWVGGSSDAAAMMGIPILNTGSAMTQLRSNWATETTYTTLQTIQPPVSPYGTIRITNDQADTDITCTVILNMGD